MPNGLLPDEGIGDSLRAMLQNSAVGGDPWVLLLFANDYTPTRSTVLADLIEPTWPGYFRKNLSRAGWLAPTVTAACASSEWGTAPQQWTVGAATSEKVYGYALLDLGAGKLRFVQRLEAADIVALVNGATLKLLPKITLTSCACP